jgi:hypothetical protein
MLWMVLNTVVSKYKYLNKQTTNSLALVRKQTIQTERPPLVVEVSANILRIEGVTWSAQQIRTAVFSVF